MQRSIKCSQSSSLIEIADEIASLWLLQPFPSQTQNGMLEFNAKPEERQKNILQRSIHGYQNACRVAALIDVLFTLYTTHLHYFSQKIQAEITALSTDKLKKIQIVGLMRSAGRTRDSDSGSLFSTQGKLECKAYLLALGVEASEAEELSDCIVLSETADPDMSLATALLADATLLETIRDGLPYDVKQIPFTNFRFYQFLSIPRAAKPVKDLIEVCYHGASLIAQHTGYLMSAITGANGLPICSDWPLTTPDQTVDLNKAATQQNELEQNPLCYQSIYNDVTKVLKLLNDAVVSMVTSQDLLDRFFAFLTHNKLDWNQTDNAGLIAYKQQFMYDNRGTLVDLGNGYIYEFDWAYLEHVLVYKLGSQYTSYFKFIEGKFVIIYDEAEQAYYHLFSQHAVAIRDQQYLRLLSMHHDEFSIAKNVITRKGYGNFQFYAIRLTGHQQWYLQVQPEQCCPIAMLIDRHPFITDKFPDMLDTTRTPEAPVKHANFTLPKRRLIKVIRFDYLSHINDFLHGLTTSEKSPDKTRLRYGRHRRYVATSQGVMERSKKTSPYPSALPAPIDSYSKHQSCTFVSNNAQPAVFSPDGKRDKLAGFMLNADDAVVNRAFIENIMSYKRRYESHSLTKIKKFYDQHFNGKAYYKKVDGQTDGHGFDIEQFMKAIIGLKNHNEVMACFRWMAGQSAACIFSDTFEARCIATMFAALTEQMLKKKYNDGELAGSWNDQDSIPIRYYLPDNAALNLKEYSSPARHADRIAANEILMDAKLSYNKFCAHNYEFLIIVDYPAAVLSTFFKLRPILFHLLDEGLFHLADYLYARTGLPGSMCDYIKHQMLFAAHTGYYKEYLTASMVVYAAVKGRMDILTMVLEANPYLVNRHAHDVTALCEAAFHGQVEAVRYLISKFADVNLRNKGKSPVSALFNAVKFSHHEIVDMLFIAGARDTSIYTKYARSLIHIAVANDDLEMVKRLVAKSPTDLKLLDKNNKTALHYALEREHVDIVRYLITLHDGDLLLILIAQGQNTYAHWMLDQFPDLLNYANATGTGLYTAAANINLEMVNLFLKRKAELEKAVSLPHATPLTIACSKGYVGIAEALLTHGANTDILVFDKPNVSGKSLMSIAIANKGNNMILLLARYTKAELPTDEFIAYFMDRVKNDNVSFFKAAVQRYPSLLTLPVKHQTVKNLHRYEVLHVLIQLINPNKSAIITYLADMKTDDIIEYYLRLIYVLSAKAGNLALVMLISEKHAQVCSQSAIVAAASTDRHVTVEYLIHVKTDVNATEKERHLTGLDWAARNACLTTLKTFIKHKARINLNTVVIAHKSSLRELWEASHLFVDFTPLDFLRVTLQRKLDFVENDYIKSTFPLHTAVKANDLHLTQLLVGERENINDKDNDHKKPQDLGFALEIEILCYANKLAKRKTEYSGQMTIFGKTVGVKSMCSKSDKQAAVGKLIEFMLMVNKHRTALPCTAASNELIPHLLALQDSTLGELFERLRNHSPYRYHLATLPVYDLPKSGLLTMPGIY